MSADDVLDLLESVRKTGRGWAARCPAHDDKSPSLSIASGDGGRVLLYCHAGCDFTDICDALGIAVSDLYTDSGRGDSWRHG